MISPLLTEKQKQESEVRMNGTPTRLADAFSAQLAKQITDKEELLFKIICIKNALEMGVSRHGARTLQQGFEAMNNFSAKVAKWENRESTRIDVALPHVSMVSVGINTEHCEIPR